ncbi:hypothetical protein [Alkalihalobacterium alkalinitrilicum]|uniref:hypothetical protein n=1 Tax=Alkalihalobacterium alkalinitrilicum TaxID=427920 RepID=UPI001C57C2A8|nr:hypothetical protein [Alkalihalobacterium alkalinitrilicum]
MEEKKKQKGTDANVPKQETEMYDPWDLILFGPPIQPEIQAESQQPKNTKKSKK